MHIETEEREHRGIQIRIKIHHDEDMGPPWVEHGGHGLVSDWVTRNKKPGELLLCEDRNFRRYYDFKEATEIAKRDGWGISPEAIAEMSLSIGRNPTKSEIVRESVLKDFNYLRGWANDEWHWVGFTTEFILPDGSVEQGESVWGFDDRDYMISEAFSLAKSDAETIADELNLLTATKEGLEPCPQI